uniref:ATP synthase F0 subunit 8 n=1 Tax=Stephanitis chinensis TaxID=2045229 RepID=A0A343L793_9HEMI|nr:ATP synthase F0 subunit 8 [Stephanitis chinensis]
MPQMSPMWWTMIYISSITILFSNMIIMYFYKNNMKSISKINFLNKTVKNWKW